jgi:hypothetical protein
MKPIEESNWEVGSEITAFLSDFYIELKSLKICPSGHVYNLKATVRKTNRIVVNEVNICSTHNPCEAYDFLVNDDFIGTVERDSIIIE